MVTWNPGVKLEELEKQVILAAMKFFDGDKTKCSFSLGIAVRTLYDKMEKYKKDDELKGLGDDEELKRRNSILARFKGEQPPDPGSLRVIPEPHPASVKAPDRYYAAQDRQNGTTAGVRVESASEDTKEQSLPMPEREEVQGVLPKQASKGSANKVG